MCHATATIHCQIKATKTMNSTCADSLSSSKQLICLCSTFWNYQGLLFCCHSTVCLLATGGLVFWELIPPFQKGNIFILYFSFLQGISGPFFFQMFQTVPSHFLFFSLCACSVVSNSLRPHGLTLRSSMDCSLPGSSVLHSFPESAQIHVHWVGDAV